VEKVLLEKLTVTQLVKKFTTFYGICKFITVFTRAACGLEPNPFSIAQVIAKNPLKSEALCNIS
jgi:hypothetical protein